MVMHMGTAPVGDQRFAPGESPQPGDVVWGQLDNYPWWPAQIVPPDKGHHLGVANAANTIRHEEQEARSTGRSDDDAEFYLVGFFGEDAHNVGRLCSHDFLPKSKLKKFTKETIKVREVRVSLPSPRFPTFSSVHAST